MNVPGESTLRREFLRLQQENKSNSEALKQQQQQLQQQQQRDPEAHIKHLLHQRQRRIEEQKEERRRVEEVGLSWKGLVQVWLSNLSRSHPWFLLGSRENREQAGTFSPLSSDLCGKALSSLRGPAPRQTVPLASPVWMVVLSASIQSRAISEKPYRFPRDRSATVLVSTYKPPLWVCLAPFI